MQEFITPLQQNIKALYEKLNKQLSLDWIGFDIDYKESHYSFYPPTTPQEQKYLDKQKKAFIKRLLKDTLKQAVDAIVQNQQPEWGAIVSFDDPYLSKWETIEPSEQPALYEVIDEQNNSGIRAKPLTTDSQYVFAERQDLTPEMWQKFFEDKFKNTFDSNPQHATITDEISNG